MDVIYAVLVQLLFYFYSELPNLLLWETGCWFFELSRSGELRYFW